MHMISNARAVITALGGPSRVAKWFGIGSTAVTNWSAHGKLPAHTYVLLMQELHKLGLTARPDLWNMTLVRQVWTERIRELRDLAVKPKKGRPCNGSRNSTRAPRS